MTINELIAKSEDFISSSKGNYIDGKSAPNEDNANLRIFDSPLIGFGSPDDLLYNKFASSEVASEDFLLPKQWLSGAKTVVSVFMPYGQAIKKSNAEDFSWPSIMWLYARYEGQLFIREFARYLCNLFEEHGAKSVIPAADPRYKTGDTRDKSGGEKERFLSNWSERHVAYACGLGTFGLSKGLITEKGTCGRFCSLVTEIDFPKTERNYIGVYDYCNNCGDCIRNCPVNAVSEEEGKNDLLCSNFLDKTFEKHNPRYGCGKCQVGVSCESHIPLRK